VRIGLGHIDSARRDLWASRIDEAELKSPADFTANNGWVVAALQGAWSATSVAALQGAWSAIAGGAVGCGVRREFRAVELASNPERLARSERRGVDGSGAPDRRRWRARGRNGDNGVRRTAAQLPAEMTGHGAPARTASIDLPH